MTIDDCVEYIKLILTGGVLELEIPDDKIAGLVKLAFSEIQRYINETVLVEVPYSSCIDLSGFKYRHIVSVFRNAPVGGDMTMGNTSAVDPSLAGLMVTFGGGGGTIYNLNNYVMNFASYSMLEQMRNTYSTDMDFREDRQSEKLYISTSTGKPTKVCIEYVPEFDDVSQLKTPYWKDMVKKMALAYTKSTLGMIRSRFTMNSLPVQQDGERMREEGNAELAELRESLRKNKMMFLPED